MKRKGNPAVLVRIPRPVLAAAKKQLRSRNRLTRGVPWELQDWIRAAILEKLKHSARSRGDKADHLRGLSPVPESGR